MARNTSLETNCMTVVVGKNASQTGRVLLAHNEDDYVHARVKHYYVPAADWPEGTLLPAENGKTAIPQVGHTYGYYWIEINGPEGGLSTSDCFLNENGVCVVSDSSCGSAEDETVCEGGIVYELRRAVAERAQSAKHALSVACELMDRYGYASGGRIYFFADRDEAYMLQIVRGHHYVGCRIPDDAVCVMPNHYTIHSLRGLENAVYPADLITYAMEKGWYKPQAEDYADFDFAASYQAPSTYRHPENTLRQKYATQMLLGREWDTDAEGYPPYVRATHPIGIRELMDVMSTHYEGSADDVRVGTGASPHDTPVRRICTGTTVEAFICDFASDKNKTTLWTAFGRPCQQVFVPLHPVNGLCARLREATDPFEAALHHFERKPGDTSHGDGLWQAFQDFQNKYELQYASRITDIRRLKEKAFSHFAKQERDFKEETQATDFTELDDRSLLYALDEMTAFLKNEPADVKSKLLSAVITRKDSLSRAHLRFALAAEPLESSLSFGPGRTGNTHDNALAAKGSLLKQTDGTWTADLVFPSQPLKQDGEGLYEFFFAGQTEDGADFCEKTILNLDHAGNGTLS